MLLGCNSPDAVVQIEYMRKVLLANELVGGETERWEGDDKVMRGQQEDEDGAC